MLQKYEACLTTCKRNKLKKDVQEALRRGGNNQKAAAAVADPLVSKKYLLRYARLPALHFSWLGIQGLRYSPSLS